MTTIRIHYTPRSLWGRLIRGYEAARRLGDYATADHVREVFRAHGYALQNTPQGTHLIAYL